MGSKLASNPRLKNVHRRIGLRRSFGHFGVFRSTEFPLMLQMDGDSSTTDASQLGITGEYMASGHYVLQSQEGEGRQKSGEQVELSGL